jgi:aminoglycoside/choline kinase family phosphotransferase
MTLPKLDRALHQLYGQPTPAAKVAKLRGDASTRSYYRVRIEDAGPGLPGQLIIMQLPHDAFRSDEGGEQANSARIPFLEVAELLESRGLPVPKIYAEDLTHGIVLLEDLGNTTLEKRLRDARRSEWQEIYATAIDLVAELHERCSHLPETSIVVRRRFDRQLLEWELEHFREWGLEALFGELTSHQTETLHLAFGAIVREIEAMPYGFVHRDYQSRNLMVQPNGSLTLLDFQDALMGPRAYDLAALLCDSYVSLDLDLQESMIERYARLRRIDPASLRREFWLVALHRKLKDAGRFVYIDRVRKNPDFLRWYPQSLVYVGRAAARCRGFEALQDLLREKIPGFPDRVPYPASSME